jgi:hypothetical protein
MAGNRRPVLTLRAASMHIATCAGTAFAYVGRELIS